MKNQTTIKTKKLLDGEVCLSGNASSQPVGEFLNKGVEMKYKPTHIAPGKWAVSEGIRTTIQNPEVVEKAINVTMVIY